MALNMANYFELAPKLKHERPWLGTNLIHDFTTMTFSVKLAFCEKRLFP